MSESNAHLAPVATVNHHKAPERWMKLEAKKLGTESLHKFYAKGEAQRLQRLNHVKSTLKSSMGSTPAPKKKVKPSPRRSRASLADIVEPPQLYTFRDAAAELLENEEETALTYPGGYKLELKLGAMDYPGLKIPSRTQGSSASHLSMGLLPPPPALNATLPSPLAQTPPMSSPDSTAIDLFDLGSATSSNRRATRRALLAELDAKVVEEQDTTPKDTSDSNSIRGDSAPAGSEDGPINDDAFTLGGAAGGGKAAAALLLGAHSRGVVHRKANSSSAPNLGRQSHKSPPIEHSNRRYRATGRPIPLPGGRIRRLPTERRASAPDRPPPPLPPPSSSMTSSVVSSSKNTRAVAKKEAAAAVALEERRERVQGSYVKGKGLAALEAERLEALNILKSIEENPLVPVPQHKRSVEGENSVVESLSEEVKTSVPRMSKATYNTLWALTSAALISPPPGREPPEPTLPLEALELLKVDNKQDIITETSVSVDEPVLDPQHDVKWAKYQQWWHQRQIGKEAAAIAAKDVSISVHKIDVDGDAAVLLTNVECRSAVDVPGSPVDSIRCHDDVVESVTTKVEGATKDASEEEDAYGDAAVLSENVESSSGVDAPTSAEDNCSNSNTVVEPVPTQERSLKIEVESEEKEKLVFSHRSPVIVVVDDSRLEHTQHHECIDNLHTHEELQIESAIVFPSLASELPLTAESPIVAKSMPSAPSSLNSTSSTKQVDVPSDDQNLTSAQHSPDVVDVEQRHVEDFYGVSHTLTTTIATPEVSRDIENDADVSTSHVLVSSTHENGTMLPLSLPKIVVAAEDNDTSSDIIRHSVEHFSHRSPIIQLHSVAKCEEPLAVEEDPSAKEPVTEEGVGGRIFLRESGTYITTGVSSVSVELDSEQVEASSPGKIRESSENVLEDACCYEGDSDFEEDTGTQ